MNLPTLALSFALLAPAALAAQSLAGSYVYDGPNGRVTLSLTQDSPTHLRGTMLGTNGLRFQLQGQIVNGRATGSVSTDQGSGYFAAGFEGGTLVMVVAELDPATQQPRLDQGWRLDFRRTGGPGGEPSSAGGPDAPRTPSAGGVAPPAPAGASGPTSDSPLAQTWLQRLRGMKVTYIESYNSSGGGGGYSENWEAFLCSDMTFHYQRRFNLSVDNGAFGNRNSQTRMSGTWRIVTQGSQAAIEYRANTGESDHVLLATRGDEVLWDGKRVFVTAENTVCR